MKKILILIVSMVVLFTGCMRTIPTTISQPENIEPVKSKENIPIDENGNKIVYIATDKNEYIPRDLFQAINAFNELENGYIVQPVIYAKDVMGTNESGGLQTADMRLQMDIMQEEKLDIVYDGAFTDISRYDILSEKGAFIDFYELLDGENGISKSELNEHILKLHENNGKLYQMPLYYAIETLGGDVANVGSKENWTLDELIEHWNAMPKGSFFCGEATKWIVYMDLIRGNLGSFVDYKNGKCNFDSDEFIKLLEFCNRFPDTAEKISTNWETKYFLDYCHFDGFDDFHLYITGANSLGSWSESGLKTTPHTFVGYPSENGNGSFVDTQRNRYSICRNSKNKEGAWNFISYLLSYDVQVNHELVYNSDDDESHDENGFPINVDAFNKLADDQIRHQGESRVLSFSGTEVDIGYLTTEEYQRLDEFIQSLNRMDAPVDSSVQKIIESEIDAYFSGERSAKEVANAIQGRVEILFSERM